MKSLWIGLTALLCVSAANAAQQTVTLEGKEYSVTVCSDAEIGPGIRHTRFRLPSFPLNINVIRIDLSNPYNRIETTVANESARGTESLVHAAERQSYAGHRALAGANANFWIVATQPEEKVYMGTTRNASVRNGVIVTESNQHRDQWDGGTRRTGVVSIDTDKKMHVDYCTSTIGVTSDKFGRLEIHQSNKGVHTDELCMYNSFYGANRAFLPIKVVNGKYEADEPGDATEVILDFVEGNSWGSSKDIALKVVEVRRNAGGGTLGEHDLALVGRGDNAGKIAALVPGDVVTVSYSWTYGLDTTPYSPAVEQAVGGNALVMRNGELTEHNSNEGYNSQVYSRTGYGCSADGKTLYIIVIDKSSDPVYGTSAGCNTAKMCEFAKWLGCSNMANFDAGGSAEMLVNGRIENRTTEGSPRAVANGWLVYSIAPEDTPEASVASRIEFVEPMPQVPRYGEYTPVLRAYNSYGAVITYDYKDFTLSCEAGQGTCEGSTWIAPAEPGTYTVTATGADGAAADVQITVLDCPLSLRINPLLIDSKREYPVEVIATAGDTQFDFNPARLAWSVADPSVISIDANGVMKGLAEGHTTYTCSLGDFEATGDVTVEIAPQEIMAYDDWTDWTAKGSSGISNVKVSESGVVSFTYGSPRDPYVQLSKVFALYSIPDAVKLEFKSSVAVKSIRADIRTPKSSKASPIVVEPEGGYEAGQMHTVDLPLTQLGDPDDLAMYPLSVNSIRLNILPDSSNKGEQSLTLGRLYAQYSSFGGVNTVEIPHDARIRVCPNPVAAASMVTVHAEDVSKVEIFSNSGMAVASRSFGRVDNPAIPAPSVPGAYVVRVSSSDAVCSSILIVK